MTKSQTEHVMLVGQRATGKHLSCVHCVLLRKLEQHLKFRNLYIPFVSMNCNSKNGQRVDTAFSVTCV